MKKKKGLENWTFTEHTDHKMNRGKLQIIYLTTMFRTEIRRESKKYERWKRQETVESNDFIFLRATIHKRSVYRCLWNKIMILRENRFYEV